MIYNYLLALDPSGSYFEGRGTTGWCVFNCMDKVVSVAGDIYAGNYDTVGAYWDAHLQLITRFNGKYNNLAVIIEDYILYGHKVMDQINSRMETSKLIGILQQHCFSKDIPYFMQLAAEVKPRWTDAILHHKNYIIKKGEFFVLPLHTDIRVNKHRRDAIRHAVHFATFKNEYKNVRRSK